LPDLPSGYFNRSIILLALKERTRAIEDLRKALQLDPTNTKYRDQYNELQASEVKRP
jgi:tetratricopeptide (TPR) repeat protein